VDDENDGDHRALVGLIIGIAVTIAITVALASGVVATMGSAPAPSASAPSASAPSASAPSASAPSASAPPASAPPASAPAAAAGTPAPTPAASTATLYFASGQKALAADAAATLAPVLEALKAGADRRVAISGFHDRTGNAEVNAELAKQRAMAVRDALVAAGVAEARIELRRPVQTEGDGTDREARRVEVSVE
jgi:outer membrane protein OmpA-like peptidoglycan-associated protein